MKSVYDELVEPSYRVSHRLSDTVLEVSEKMMEYPIRSRILIRHTLYDWVRKVAENDV
jgi:hypothetical protein